MSGSSELSRIDRLARIFGSFPPAPGVLAAIGDDAAVLSPGSTKLVWTVDAAVEGVHFRREWLSLEDLGWRSLMAAASDLAAMGARPRGVLSALALPDNISDDELEAIARGQAEAAKALATAVIGGNLTRAAELSITTTVLGEAERPLERSGARAGDVLAVSGELGLARAGVQALTRGDGSAETQAAIQIWRRPEARIGAGLAAARAAHAAIDISDGLSLDAFRMGSASHVQVRLRERDVLQAAGPRLAAAARALALSPLELALIGGEDYALLASFAGNEVPPGFVPIGRCADGQGLVLEAADGTERDLDPTGYDHFA
jgi:thiamine-monophosphate kinase